MKNLSYLIFCLFYSNNIFSQVLNVEYQFINNNRENPALSLRQTYSLVVTNNYSLCEKLEQNTIHKFEEIGTEEKKEVFKQKLSDDYAILTSKKKTYFYKDYLLDSLKYSTLILTKQVSVGEKVNMFEWQVSKKDTIYLDTKCHIATTNHRGHTWTVFFSDRFDVKGGPWKLDGLPGVILYASTEDKAFIFDAIRIEVTSNNVEIINPFIGEKVISWEDFKKSYKDRLLRQVKKANSLNENGEKDTVIKLGNMIEDLGFKEIRQ